MNWRCTTVPDMKQIHDFAVKWCDKFRAQNINYIDLVDHFMADDCAASRVTEYVFGPSVKTTVDPAAPVNVKTAVPFVQIVEVNGEVKVATGVAKTFNSTVEGADSEPFTVATTE